jgi:hypothetical protein
MLHRLTPPIPALLTFAVIFASCSVLEEAAPPPSPTPVPSENAIRNPGFEEGLDPWTTLPPPAAAEIIDEARTGDASVRLVLPSHEGAATDLAVAAVQQMQPTAFPEFVSGYYYVADWTAATTGLQYLEIAVTVRTGDFADERDVHTVRFALAGAAVEPAATADERWIMLDRDQPDTGRWIYFGYPLRQAFISEWGRTPSIWGFIDVTIAVRSEQDADGEAVVMFDDLYLGAQLGNPNRPD